MRQLGIAIGIGMVLGFLCSITVLFFIPIPTKNETLITYMLGQLSGFTSAVVAFYFGQTAGGSKASDNTASAFEAIKLATLAGSPQRPTGTPGDPVHVQEENQ